MRFSEAKNHRVMSVRDAATVGRLQRIAVDPATSSIAGLKLRKTTGEGDTLAWSELEAFGRDAVTIDSADRIVRASGDLQRLLSKDYAVLGKRVLSVGGVDLGTVKDIDFDMGSGAVLTVITERHEVPGTGIVGLGSYALVVDPARR
ncbi:MAG: PRC-barrel domain-containing protein [Actinomycetota bacterium]|nr:PRC-barrel domain-containing protein [Actinomycetota bacterium]